MNKPTKAKGLRKLLGLMFRTRKTAPLEFEFKKEVNIPIHSFFVFFPFKATWYDKKNNVIEKRIVKPFRCGIKPSRPFSRLVEEPCRI